MSLVLLVLHLFFPPQRFRSNSNSSNHTNEEKHKLQGVSVSEVCHDFLGNHVIETGVGIGCIHFCSNFMTKLCLWITKSPQQEAVCAPLTPSAGFSHVHSPLLLYGHCFAFRAPGKSESSRRALRCSSAMLQKSACWFFFPPPFRSSIYHSEMFEAEQGLRCSVKNGFQLWIPGMKHFHMLQQMVEQLSPPWEHTTRHSVE